MLGSGGNAAQIAWVVGEFDDGLTAIPEREAQSLAVLHDALLHATTWGDLLNRIQDYPEVLREVRERYGEELPVGSYAFDADDIRGFSEGDWPEHPRETMIRTLPDSIASLGVVGPTLFGEGLLRIAPGRRRDVVQRLRQLGVLYREDDGLVSRACGGWRYG